MLGRGRDNRLFIRWSRNQLPRGHSGRQGRPIRELGTEGGRKPFEGVTGLQGGLKSRPEIDGLIHHAVNRLAAGRNPAVAHENQVHVHVVLELLASPVLPLREGLTGQVGIEFIQAVHLRTDRRRACSCRSFHGRSTELGAFLLNLKDFTPFGSTVGRFEMALRPEMPDRMAEALDVRGEMRRVNLPTFSSNHS